jgi:O-6-methylguanine DNA methyltransferase
MAIRITPQGPKVRVTLHFENLQFKNAFLSLSDEFEYSIEGKPDEKIKDRLLEFLDNYGKKNPSKIDLNLEILTPFRKKTLRCLQEVPFGEAVSYGELAAKIGHPRAARAVGTACHFNPFPLFIPCHRVIAAGGGLGGFALDLRMKKLLLEFESVD